MAYDQIADPNQTPQADQASQEAITPSTRGRFAQGFGARAKTRGGLGQKAMDASRMFWEDQPRAPDPMKSNFGGGSAVGYQKQDVPDITPPGYQLAHYVDMMGVRHDYLDSIANPKDMSYLNDKYKTPKADEPKHEDKTVAATPPAYTPTTPAPVAAPVTPTPVSDTTARPDVVAQTRTPETLSTPPVLNKPAVPASSPSAPTILGGGWDSPSFMTPTKTVPYGTPQSAPVVAPPVAPPTPTQASGWGTPTGSSTPLTGPVAGQPAEGGTPTVAAGWGTPALPATRLTGPTLASDVTVKEEVKPVKPIDVDGFLSALTAKK